MLHSFSHVDFFIFPISLFRISFDVWQTREDCLLSSHRRFWFLLDWWWFSVIPADCAQARLSSVMPLLLLCCCLRYGVAWTRPALHPSPACFLLHLCSLFWIYSCFIYSDLFHIHHYFHVSSVVSSNAFIHWCCHFLRMHTSVALPPLSSVLCPE